MIKIAFVGVESSGKTFLSDFFAKKYQTNKTIEYADWYCQNVLKGYFKNDSFLTQKSDYVKIVNEQEKINAQVFKTKNEVCFFDSDYIYTKYFIDKQYVSWNWIDFFIKAQKIEYFIFLKIKNINIKPGAIITEETITNETYTLLSYYKKFVKTKLIIVESEDYAEQTETVIKLIDHLLNK